MKIRYGVIGCGGIAYRRTIKGIVESENSSLVAVMDRNEQICKMVADEYKVEYTTDIDELLQKDIDAVYIATPVFCHLEQVKKAARAKKHILLEKPFGLNAKEAKEIIDICNRENVLLGAGFMMRYHKQHEKIRKIIADGEIGDVVSFRTQFSCLYPDIEGAWRQKKDLSGGGALIDLGAHCIDILKFILQDEVKSVFANCSTQTFSYEVDDSASLMLAMKNGAVGHVDVNFNIPDDASQSKLEIYGTKGSIVALGTLAQEECGVTNVIISNNSAEYDAMQSKTEAKAYTVTDNGGNLYEREITDFSNCINNGFCKNDALYVQKICDLAYRSSEEGKVVFAE